MWGRNSVKIAADSALGHLKARCVQELVAGTPDRQNATPHINVDGDREVASKLHRSGLQLRFEHLRVRDNFVDIDVGFNRHYTLAFVRGLRDQPNVQPRLMAVWRQWAAFVASRPDPPPVQPALASDAVGAARKRRNLTGASAAASAGHGASTAPASAAASSSSIPATVAAAVNEATDECKICLSEPLGCLIDCPHLCMCFDCAQAVDACPICRQPITMRIRKRVIVS